MQNRAGINVMKGDTEKNKATREAGDDREPIVLAFCADENFAMPLSVAMYSALINLKVGREVFVYVLDGGIEAGSKAKLREVANRVEHITVNLQICTPDAALTGELERLERKMSGRFSRATLLLLKLADIIPSKFGKVIFIDSDTVTEKNLARLWEEDVSGYALMARKTHLISNPRFGVARWKELGLRRTAPYFNSGVLLINTDRWRDQDVGVRSLSYLQTHADGGVNRLDDQEGLNAILAGKWKMFDPVWNVTLHRACDKAHFERVKREENIPGEREHLLQTPHIIHYTYHSKPWIAVSSAPLRFRHRFYFYLKKSGWFTHSDYIRWRAGILFKHLRWQKGILLGYLSQLLFEKRSRSI